MPYEEGSMDGGFKGRYKILEAVFGSFPHDTIEFVAYDHYGIPEFSKYKHVVLYVSADGGTYFHQKYQFHDVYKTKDGRWAGTWLTADYEHSGNRQTSVKPEIIDFADTVFYPRKGINDDGEAYTLAFPKPYFKEVGDSVMAVYGNYVNDLFLLTRDGVLTSRRIFKDGQLAVSNSVTH